jgi:hypothetical protein
LAKQSDERIAGGHAVAAVALGRRAPSGPPTVAIAEGWVTTSQAPSSSTSVGFLVAPTYPRPSAMTPSNDLRSQGLRKNADGLHGSMSARSSVVRVIIRPIVVVIVVRVIIRVIVRMIIVRVVVRSIVRMIVVRMIIRPIVRVVVIRAAVVAPIIIVDLLDASGRDGAFERRRREREGGRGTARDHEHCRSGESAEHAA